MAESNIIRSTCGLCFSGCGVLVHVEDNRIVKVEGDPGSPVNKGVLCPKGLAAIEYQYHPQRLRRPLKRDGKRGEGRWREIPWEEAFEQTARGLTGVKERLGAESVAFVQGTARGLINTYMARLSNVFGTPNFSTSGHVCFLPRYFSSNITNGFYPVPDYEGSPDCILVWGANMASTRLGEHISSLRAVRGGSRLIVVDPTRTKLAEKAEHWLRVRPGADLALALGIINLIIRQKLYDPDFIEKWCVGFNRLKTHVEAYTLEKVSRITWVPEKNIEKAARVYAEAKKAAIQWGNAIDHGVNSFQTARALCILRAITGNLGVSGGDIETTYPLSKENGVDISLGNRLSKESWNKRVGADAPMIPLFRRVLPQHIVRAVLEKNPYPVKGLFVHGANPLLTFGNASKVLKALKALDFIVVCDRFMTPTTAMADIILPAATFFEYDSIISPPYYPIIQVQQKTVHTDGAMSDFDIVNGIGRCLGKEKDFPDDMEGIFDMLLKQEGVTFSEFRRIGHIVGAKHHRVFEKKGFNTPSGKVELFSSRLAGWGFDPLPVYHEPPETPYSDPEGSEAYPFVLTSRKSAFFRHSDYRQVPSLRKGHPEPRAWIHPDTARDLGLQYGDSMSIVTRRGKAVYTCTLDTSLDPRVVVADFGWWFPEQEVVSLYGWSASNINILTDDKPPFSPEIGSNNFRGLFCNVERV